MRGAGLALASPVPLISTERLAVLPCLDDARPRDPLATQIRADLSAAGSVLGLMKRYMTDLVGDRNNNALPLRKLCKLFKLGAVPERLAGHYYGVTLGLRTGDLPEPLADFGNLLGCVWGSAVGENRAWSGETFTPMSDGDRHQITGKVVPDDVPMYRGTNHFKIIDHAPINLAGNALINFMWHLADAPTDQRLRYGHQRDGGHCVAHRAASVYPGTPRQVMRLNYRFSGLGNHPPLPHLITELVEIAPGILLGQLAVATAGLLETYDPTAEDAAYHYQHCGFVLLFEASLNVVARELFPHLEIPQAAIVTRVVGHPPPRVPAQLAAQPAAQPAEKFTTLTLAASPPASAAELLTQVRHDLGDAATILQLLQSYSDALNHTPTTGSTIFAKLRALHDAGIPPQYMNGYYHAALISWVSPGLLGSLGVNSLNLAWRLCRGFSPWTGKRFDPVEPRRLLARSDGHEGLDVPTQLCSNTLAFRTRRERLARGALKLMRSKFEPASASDKREHGYEAKTSFSIGRRAPSVDPAKHGALVYQCNYRWKGLHNPLPESLRIDELVQIADGLYLGQVYYATKALVPWSPNTAPASYGYHLYEYFLLMDPQWQALRMSLGFDLDNA
ncbi:hypothetical protein DB30_03776 [Enhygromyxa salina]|uniref:Uncharacterized protein n=1 Tax=Enhygromyxa salina TaxID=215803 RepID=A0A0C1ZHW5_9BACT|nr:hypothetical protein DB30_03776 [Enhygromyxa salina]